MNTQGQHLPLLTLLQQFTVETDRYVDRVSVLNGLHRTDMHALAFLVQAYRSSDPVTPGKLGEVLNLSSPATTALLDRLDRSGHVRRERGGPDRRRVQVTVTDRARRLGSMLFSPLAEHLGSALDGYSADELRFAERFMADMIKATTAARADVPEP